MIEDIEKLKQKLINTHVKPTQYSIINQYQHDDLIYFYHHDYVIITNRQYLITDIVEQKHYNFKYTNMFNPKQKFMRQQYQLIQCQGYLYVNVEKYLFEIDTIHIRYIQQLDNDSLSKYKDRLIIFLTQKIFLFSKSSLTQQSLYLDCDVNCNTIDPYFYEFNDHHICLIKFDDRFSKLVLLTINKKYDEILMNLDKQNIEKIVYYQNGLFVVKVATNFSEECQYIVVDLTVDIKPKLYTVTCSKININDLEFDSFSNICLCQKQLEKLFQNENEYNEYKQRYTTILNKQQQKQIRFKLLRNSFHNNFFDRKPFLYDNNQKNGVETDIYGNNEEKIIGLIQLTQIQYHEEWQKDPLDIFDTLINLFE